MVYLANVSMKSYINKGNKFLEKVADFVKSRGNNEMVIPFSVKFEEELLDAELSGGKKPKRRIQQI